MLNQIAVNIIEDTAFKFSNTTFRNNYKIIIKNNFKFNLILYFIT